MHNIARAADFKKLAGQQCFYLSGRLAEVSKKFLHTGISKSATYTVEQIWGLHLM
jgi:hypothetical protein